MIFCLTFPAHAFAGDPEPPEPIESIEPPEKKTPIFVSSQREIQKKLKRRGRFAIIRRKGDRAPFPGVLYDPLGNAIILAAPERSNREREVELERRIRKAEADATRLRLLGAAQAESEQRKHQRIVAAKDREILALREEAAKPGPNPWVYGAIGVAIGAVVTGLAVGFASK